MDKKILLGVIIGIAVLLVTMIIFVILDRKRKKKANSNSVFETPNLMASDPIQNGNVNLMAPDPVLSVPVQAEFEKPSEFVEEQGLENQLMSESPMDLSTTNDQIVAPSNQSINNMNAFEMPLPAIDNNINSDYGQNAISQKTQKFCPNCKTPNDVLNKYCTSCGYTFE